MLRLPRGACNAHCHVFGPRQRFAYAPDAPFVPDADAPKEALFALNDRLGFERCVVVQSLCHGDDNRVTEEALAARAGAYRGIALLRPGVPDAELKRLDGVGFRGVRFTYMAGGLGAATPPIGDALALAQRLEPLGWHLQLQLDATALLDLGPVLRRSPVPLVIDHMARIDASRGLDQPAFRALLDLMADERFWVKLSGIDRVSRSGLPYADALPFARKLVIEFGDRVLWGNDWPHPNPDGPPPDDEQLVQAIGAMAQQPVERERLLVGNPQRLYRFVESPTLSIRSPPDRVRGRP